jgi:acetoacetyl-CoA synthetase
MNLADDSHVLWRPSPATIARANLTTFANWLGDARGLDVTGSYDALWEWSIRDLPDFWSAVWEYFDVRADAAPQAVLSDERMPGAVWFPGSTLNYAEHALRTGRPEAAAIVSASEGTDPEVVTWEALRGAVGAFAATLRELGVAPGDRVVGYLPNIPEAVTAFLGCAAVGAVWSSCSPDFGTRSVVDRFRQIEPVLLVAATGYRYGGKVHDRQAVVAELRAALPTLKHTIVIRYPEPGSPLPSGTTSWEEATSVAADPVFTPVPFDHPLWILFSSGTTGLPKGIVHGHGGILLEHLKVLAFHNDVHADDRVFWFTTTTWMMWNYLVGSLLHGATIVLYDGSPIWPDTDALWRLAERCGITILGTSAAYLLGCQKAGVRPHDAADLSRLRTVGSTASPLPDHAFRWAYEVLGADLPVHSASGGTDVCSAFVAAAATLPVIAGEIQCRALGVDLAAWDDQRRPLVGEVGELVVTRPMPSMPLYLWNDTDGSRYRATYFDTYPGVWRHGDWITITPRHGAVVHGRSDSTLNRFGVRLGTSELYGVVDNFEEIQESLAIGVELPDGGYEIILFVVLSDGRALDDDLMARIRAGIRDEASPRHVPDMIVAMPGIPHTLTGKKLEVPIKRLLQGRSIEQSVNPGAVDDSALLAHYQAWALGHLAK